MTWMRRCQLHISRSLQYAADILSKVRFGTHVSIEHTQVEQFSIFNSFYFLHITQCMMYVLFVTHIHLYIHTYTYMYMYIRYIHTYIHMCMIHAYVYLVSSPCNSYEGWVWEPHVSEVEVVIQCMCCTKQLQLQRCIIAMCVHVCMYVYIKLH